jgi:hypothetical protein
MDFTEPSAGFTLGFDFGNGDSTLAELDIAVDGAIRFYNNNDKAGVTGSWSRIGTSSGSSINDVYELSAPDIFDLRINGGPSFIYRTDLRPRITFGLKFAVPVTFSMLSVEQNYTGAASDSFTSSDTALSIAPQAGAGIVIRFLPERFSVQGGLGIELFSWSENKTDRTGSGGNTLVTRKLTGLPSASIAAGFTFNFTAAVAADFLAVSKNLDIDETTLTLLFTIKK